MLSSKPSHSIKIVIVREEFQYIYCRCGMESMILQNSLAVQVEQGSQAPTDHHIIDLTACKARSK